MHNLRKLIYSGLGAAVSAGVILPVENDPDNPDAFGFIPISLGGRSSMFLWRDIGCQEVRVSVWFDYHHNRHPGADGERFHSSEPVARRSRYPAFLGAMASAWLQTDHGYYIQGKGVDGIFDTYVGRGVSPALGDLEEPAPVILSPGGLIVRASAPYRFLA